MFLERREQTGDLVMKAIVTQGNQLEWSSVPDIDPKKGEIRIDNHAAGVNRADLVQRKGRYPPPPGASSILGLECAGIVDAIGPDVQRFEIGDKVCALLAGGGYAEQVVVPEVQALDIPAGLSFVEAASIPETFATAYLNLFMEANADLGEKILLHAGASGVGIAAIQLCKAFGNPCFVTAGSSEKVSACCELGAEDGWNRHSGSFHEAVMAWSEGQGVDVILDPVGAEYFDDNIKTLAIGGRLVLIGLMSGSKARANLGTWMSRRLQVIGSTLRARSVTEKGNLMRVLFERVWPGLEKGDIQPVIDRVYPIESVEDAHELMRTNQTVGNLVLEIGR